jgi:malonyl CoA-acyl carrier protein transacylase
VKENLASYLCQLICTLRVKWPQTIHSLINHSRSRVSHLLDFGPGGLQGIGVLTQRNVEGNGVQVRFESEENCLT